MTYVIIQGPALRWATDIEDPGSQEAEELDDAISRAETWWALVGLASSVSLFVAYLALMVRQSRSCLISEYAVDEAMLKQLHSAGPVTLTGVLAPMIAEYTSTIGRERRNSEAPGRVQAEMAGPLDPKLISPRERRRLAKLLRPFFDKYNANGDGHLDLSNLRALLVDVGENMSAAEAKVWMGRLHPDGNGVIDREKFVDAMLRYVADKSVATEAHMYASSAALALAGKDAAVAEGAEQKGEEGEEEGESEDTEVPEELRDMSWQQQQAHLKARAAKMMFVGTLLIVLFSGPAVDVMSNLAI